jgi:hypothetical protein
VQSLARDLARALDLKTSENRALAENFIGDLIGFSIYAFNMRVMDIKEKTITRQDIEDIREFFAHPQKVGELFPEDGRKRREKEWEWVLKQDWSPLKMADELLSDMPDKIHLSLEREKEKFEKRVRKFIKEAEKAKGK